MVIPARLNEKLKEEYKNPPAPEDNGILLCLNERTVHGDNERYMKMYNRMARWYNMGEQWIGKLKYGNSIARMRRELMGELEWHNGCSALYVSIGTGADLKYLPAGTEPTAIDFTGVDISLGMLKQCQKTWQNKLNLSLVHANAEDLPFVDHSFDTVFHVGGINFFSDKKRALEEMVRVAAPGTKIMIADETGDYVNEQYKKSRFTREYFKDTDVDLSEIERAIPSGMRDIKTRLLWENRFYCITFYTPQ